MRTLLVCAAVFGLSLPALADNDGQPSRHGLGGASRLATLGSPMKIGVVDFNKVFTETQTARVDRAELDQLMSKKQSEVDSRKVALERARAELATRASSMDAIARAKREAELDLEAASLKQLFTDAQALVQKRERELSGRVVADAKALAPEIAQAHGVTLVLGAAEALLWAAPTVEQVDLTTELARALDRRMASKQ
jgi:Skp family chaperone for outer membrane proteins